MNKLEGIGTMDRVRVTFEGVRIDRGMGPEIAIAMDGSSGEVQISRSELEAPTFQIERIEPPVLVGDLVTLNDGSIESTLGEQYRVLAFVGNRAVVWGALGSADFLTAELRKAPSTPVREEG